MIELLNIDCMEYMATCKDKEFDLAIVDPPYGLERFKNGGSHINKYGTENGQWNNTKPTAEYFAELFRVSKYQIIWGANNFILPTSEYFVVWQKGNALDFSFAMVEMAWTNIKKPAKLYKYLHAQCNEERIHPTQKPTKLYSWLLKNYATEGMKILDTHLGSGNIAVACHYSEMNLVGCEIDEKYYLSAMKNYKLNTAQTPLFLNEKK